MQDSSEVSQISRAQRAQKEALKCSILGQAYLLHHENAQSYIYLGTDLAHLLFAKLKKNDVSKFEISAKVVLLEFGIIILQKLRLEEVFLLAIVEQKKLEFSRHLFFHISFNFIFHPLMLDCKNSKLSKISL